MVQQLAAPRSPYRPGMGLEPPYLGDRQPQLDRFRAFLAEPDVPHNALVTGLRGVGKTVLLNHYSVEAAAAGWLVAEREFSDADAAPAPFAQAVLADLLRLTRQLSVSARVKKAAGSLADRALELLGNISVSYGEIDVSFAPGRRSPAVPKRLDDDLREALQQVGDLCRQSDHPGFVLRYDEFHVVQERSGQLTLSALLAATAAVQQRGVPLILVLCGLPSVVEHLARSKSYSERMFTTEVLGNLRPPEDRAALMGPAAKHGRQFADEVVDAVIEDTAGYPFFIQLYGDALWKGSRGEPITRGDFDRLRPEILRVLDAGFFEARYARASAAERRLMGWIAAEGESATAEQLQQRSGLENNQLQPVLRTLVRKGLVYRPERGRIAFTAPMFGAYIRRRGD
jgi:hypothetical protein